jgi:hypothetical protein
MAERGQHQLLTVDSQDDFQRRLNALTELIWRALYAHAPARVGAPGPSNSAESDV